MLVRTLILHSRFFLSLPPHHDTAYLQQENTTILIFSGGLYLPVGKGVPEEGEGSLAGCDLPSGSVWEAWPPSRQGRPREGRQPRLEPEVRPQDPVSPPGVPRQLEVAR